VVEFDELERRLVHASGAAVPALWLAGVDWALVRWLLPAGAVVALLMEAGRLSGRLDLAIYDRLTREYEQDALAGYALYMVSTGAVSLAVRPEVAVPAILMLALGDPVGGLLSSGEFRRVKRPRALAAMFLVCLLIAVPFVPALAAGLGAAGAALADGVKPVVAGYVIDDNLTIPPVAALGMLAGAAVV
jgi:dolichol kinase